MTSIMNTELRKTFSDPLDSIVRLMSFLMAGSVGLVIDAVLLLVLTDTLGWQPMPARFFSFWAAMSCTWSINRRYGFADLCAKEQSVFREYMCYLFAQGLGALVNLGTFWLALHHVPGWERHPLYALLCGSALALVFNYLSLRHFVFGQQRDHKRSFAASLDASFFDEDCSLNNGQRRNGSATFDRTHSQSSLSDNS